MTRRLDVTTVLPNHCRLMDVPVAAVLLAKGVMQGLSSGGDPDEVASTQDSMGERLLGRPQSPDS